MTELVPFLSPTLAGMRGEKFLEPTDSKVGVYDAKYRESCRPCPECIHPARTLQVYFALPYIEILLVG